jgi:hypothetical protein
MPRDVTLGEGYVEGEMTSPAMPGQHRGQYDYNDGSSVLIRPQQMEDLGRPRGGRGGRRFRGGGWGYGPVFYEPLYVEDIVARKPFILDENDDDKKKNLKGLADAANDCISKIVAVAGAAAREAVDGVRQGIFKDMNDVCAHIQRRVCAEFTAHGRAYIMAMQEAIKSAMEAAKPEVDKILSQNAKGVGRFSGLSGLAGAVSSQADYSALSAAQVRANAIMAQISGIGKDEWDAIKDEEFEAAEWSPADNYSYDNMMAFWLNNMKSLITTAKKPVMVEQINEVNRLATGTEKLIALVMSHASPGAAAQGEADKNATVQALSKSVMVSPGSVGWDTFQQEVTKRAESLVSSGIGVTTIAAIAAGLLGAVYIFGRMR